MSASVSPQCAKLQQHVDQGIRHDDRRQAEPGIAFVDQRGLSLVGRRRLRRANALVAADRGVMHQGIGDLAGSFDGVEPDRAAIDADGEVERLARIRLRDEEIGELLVGDGAALHLLDHRMKRRLAGPSFLCLRHLATSRKSLLHRLQPTRASCHNGGECARSARRWHFR
jgi:hypothetical protein